VPDFTSDTHSGARAGRSAAHGCAARLLAAALAVGCLVGPTSLPAAAAQCATSASTVFLSGTVRDFTSSQPDFNVADGDASATFLNPTLGADGTPSLASGAKLTTVQSASSFAQWWHASANPAISQSESLSQILSNQCSSDPRVYQLNNTSFYPIDNQLLGNGGGAHNSWFTYQLNGNIGYQGGEVLQYTSSDDLWVFINGHLAVDLGGVHDAKSASVSLDTAASSLGISPGNTYPIAIFFAHRSATHTSTLGLSALSATVCSALASASRVSPSPANIQMLGTAQASGSTLNVISASASGPAGGAAWYQTPLSVAPSFASEFDFTLTPGSSGTAEGFAFVVQSAGLTARGGDAGYLGYAGIPNSLAVAFETTSNASLGEPPYQAISFQTNGAQQNSANQTSSLGISGSGANLKLADGQPHHVRIQYVRGLAGAAGWLRVYTYPSNDPSKGLAPVTQAQIPAATFAAIAAPNAYLGFTAASSQTVGETLAISNWTVTPLLPSTAQSVLAPVPTAAVAGQSLQVTLQLEDACHAALGSTGVGYAGQIQGLLSSTNPSELAVASVTDNGDGTYTLAATPSLPGSYQLAVQLAGQPIQGSPFAVTVTPAAGAPAPRPDLAGQRFEDPNGPNMYLIDEDGTARYIPDPPTLEALFPDWNVGQGVDPTTIAAGPAITSGAYLATSSATPNVYLISNGQKRWVSSPAVMAKFDFAWSQLRQVPQSTLDALPNGPTLT